MRRARRAKEGRTDDAEAPHVRLEPVPSPLTLPVDDALLRVHLGRRVARAPCDRVQPPAVALDIRREAKVGQDEVVVADVRVRAGRGAVQDVLGLEVAVDDVLRVEVGDAVL